MLKSIAATGERSPALRQSRLRSLLDIRYLALLTTVATYALIVLGGAVRATDSGLACPDWPRCHGELIPPLDRQVLIEYSHRLAAVSVGLLVFLTAMTAWLWQRENRFALIGASGALLLLLGQVLVGGATVNMELPDTVVAVHLSIALMLLAVLVFTTVGVFQRGSYQLSNGPLRASSSAARPLPVLASITALATFALIIIGSYVANSEAGLVYSDWPLFNGKLVSAGGRLAELHYAHRLMAALVGALLLALLEQTWRSERRWSVPMMAMGSAFVLYVAQVFVGASNIWLELATSVRIAHLALASALWATLVVGAAWAYLGREVRKEAPDAW